MTFEIDQQTLSDLNLFPEGRSTDSVFNYYNHTQTKGGKKQLMSFLKNPLADVEQIESRLLVLRFLLRKEVLLDFTDAQSGFRKECIEFFEFYLRQNTAALRANFIDAAWNKFSSLLKPNNDYYVIERGTDYFCSLLLFLDDFLTSDFFDENVPDFFLRLKQNVEMLQSVILPDSYKKERVILFSKLGKIDQQIRVKYRAEVFELLKAVYCLDAYLSLAEVCKTEKLSLPVIENSFEPKFGISDFFHPLLENPVKNSVVLSAGEQLCFVSGANMAGKSTFLKTIGLCVYLAHVGFPVPAEKMKISLFQALFTAINLPDNMENGYSHYYSEVRRIKDIALLLKEKKKVFVIFDELFRGTNVKDAFDATLQVLKRFSKIEKSLFFVSTHIVEVAEELKQQEKILFKCFKTDFVDDRPMNDYRLQDGISMERLGMYILKKEKVLDIIDEAIDN